MKLYDIFNEEQYDEAFTYVSENGLTIQEIEPVDGVRKFQIVEIPVPTEEEIAAAVRAKRDSYLTRYVDPLVTNPLRWAEMSIEEQDAVKAYRRYLLDIPQSEDFPEIEVLTFEEWKEQ